MGIVTLTIGGENVLPFVQIKSLSVEHSINQRPVLRCRLRIREGDPDFFRPAVRDEVILRDQNLPDPAVTIFGGIVYSVKETDVVDYKHYDFDIDCTGYEVFADSVLINGTFSGTTKEILEDIVAELADHGLEVDDLMPVGDPQPAQNFPFLTCRQAMDQLATVSGWNWKVDYEKKVRMDPPSGIPGATFELTENDTSITSLQHVRSLSNYVNEVTVLFGEPGQREKADGWTGDGSTVHFTLNYPPAGMPASVVEGGVSYAVVPVGTPGPHRWFYNAAARRFEVSGGAPANLTAITSTYMAEYPGAVTVVDDAPAAPGPWAIAIEYRDIEEFDKAEALAWGELGRRQGLVRRLTATTFKPGLEPGVSINVTALKRELSTTNFLIERVSMSHETRRNDGTHLFRYEIEALEGNQYQKNWQDYFRGLGGKRASGGGAVSGGGPGGAAVTTVSQAFWGGSRQFGLLLNDTWENVIDYLPIRVQGAVSGGTPVTVRVMQRSGGGGVDVQVRIIRTDTSAVMVTGAPTASTSWDEELLTFMPAAGPHDYVLQVRGSANTAQVFAIGSTL